MAKDMMKIDLNNWEPKASDAVDVKDTKMLDTVARETPDTVTAESRHVEYEAKNPSFGKLGAH